MANCDRNLEQWARAAKRGEVVKRRKLGLVHGPNENVDAFFNAKIRTDDDLLARLSHGQKAAKTSRATPILLLYLCTAHGGQDK